MIKELLDEMDRKPETDEERYGGFIASIILAAYIVNDKIREDIQSAIKAAENAKIGGEEMSEFRRAHQTVWFVIAPTVKALTREYHKGTSKAVEDIMFTN